VTNDRARAVIVSVVLVGATLAPIVRGATHDSFPLSTYPMFAVRRPSTLTLDYAVGVTERGERRPIAPALVGTGEVLQAGAIINDAVNAGPKALAPLCVRIASAVARDRDLDDVTTIRIVTGTHDAVAYLIHDTLGREYERWRCRVVRGAP
jgi:hypothetical protein